jgi:hypothetical protein
MPIKRDEFDKGRILSATERAVLAYLRQHKDKAFTASELASAIGYTTGSNTGSNFFLDLFSNLGLYSILERLVQEKEIIKRLVNGTTYYAAK